MAICHTLTLTSTSMLQGGPTQIILQMPSGCVVVHMSGSGCSVQPELAYQ